MKPEKGKTEIDALDERYRIIFENSGTVMVFIDAEATIVLVNKEFEKSTGYARAEVEGKMSCWELIADPDERELAQRYHHLRKTAPAQAPDMYDLKIRVKNGDLRYALFRVTMIPGTVYCLASVVDITERKLAEERLRKNEEKYRSLVNNMQDALYQSDAKGNLTFITPAGANILGFESVDEVLGKNIAANYYADPNQRKTLLEELKNEGKVTNFDVALKRRDGSAFTALINSHLLYDKNGGAALDAFLKEPEGYDLVITDYTMPHYTGIDIAVKMREVRNDIPIILCSGYVHTVLEEKAHETGINVVIRKPVRIHELAEAVRQVLDKK